jgi:hypothetical protein
LPRIGTFSLIACRSVNLCVLSVILIHLLWRDAAGADRVEEIRSTVAPGRQVREMIFGTPMTIEICGRVHAERLEVRLSLASGGHHPKEYLFQ